MARVIDTGPDDPELLERYRRGDTRAFASLVSRYQKPLFNAAFRVLGNAQDADDATQAVFLRIVERLDDYDPKHKFFSWIYRIAINEAIDMLRRTSREEPLDESFDAAAPDAGPESGLHARQVSGRVQRALMGMKMDDRIVIVLRHFSDLSYGDMAAVLAIDEKTVKSRLYEARQRLAAQLQDLRGEVA